MKKVGMVIAVIVGLILLSFFVLPRGSASVTEGFVSEEESSANVDTLVKGSTYTVLDVREFSSSKYYGGDAYTSGRRAIVLIVEDTETKNRIYVTTDVVLTKLDNNYKRIASLVVGDTFRYLGDFDYELINE